MGTRKFNVTGQVQMRARYDAPSSGALSYNGTQYGHIALHTIRVENEETRYTFDYDDRALEHLEVSCQFDNDSNMGEAYAFRVKVEDVTSLDAAQHALRVHKTVESHLTRVREKYGYGMGRTFGQWAALVCEALEITTIQVPNDKWPNSYQPMTPGDAADRFDRHIRAAFPSAELTA